MPPCGIVPGAAAVYMRNMIRAFYPGSFDPVTNGHLDILGQATALFEEVVVGIGVHPGKAPTFSFEERTELLKEAIQSMIGTQQASRVRIVAFRNLVVDAAHDAGAAALVRGVRDGTDLDYEMQMAGMNGIMRPTIRTVFLPASPANRPITATLVRQIAGMGGDVSAFVPQNVAAALRRRHGQAAARK